MTASEPELCGGGRFPRSCPDPNDPASDFHDTQPLHDRDRDALQILRRPCPCRRRSATLSTVRAGEAGLVRENHVVGHTYGDLPDQLVLSLIVRAGQIRKKAARWHPRPTRQPGSVGTGPIDTRGLARVRGWISLP